MLVLHIDLGMQCGQQTTFTRQKWEQLLGVWLGEGGRLQVSTERQREFE